MSALTGYSSSGFTTSAFAYTYNGNEMISQIYTKDVISNPDSTRVPIIKFTNTGIYVGQYLNNDTPAYIIEDETQLRDIIESIEQSKSIIVDNERVSVHVGDRYTYNNVVYKVAEKEGGKFDLVQASTYDFEFDTSDAGVIFYPNRSRNIQINAPGYYYDTSTSPANCEIANKCYVKTVSGNIISYIQNLHTDYNNTVYHADSDYLKGTTNRIMPFLFAPTSDDMATSAWTMGHYYYITCLNYEYQVNFSTSKVLATYGFYETSDERMKDFQSDINVDLDILSKIPKKYFTWKDNKEKKRQIGTSAQMLLPYYPELVSEDDNGQLTVDYAKLSVIALAAVDELHKENLELKERLRRIEEKLGL